MDNAVDNTGIILQKGPLYRFLVWSRIWTDWDLRKGVSVCKLFWGVVGALSFLIATTGGFLFLIYALFTVRRFQLTVLIILSLFLMVFSLYRSSKVIKQKINSSTAGGIILGRLRAIKQRVCPIVRFV